MGGPNKELHLDKLTFHYLHESPQPKCTYRPSTLNYWTPLPHQVVRAHTYSQSRRNQGESLAVPHSLVPDDDS